MDLNKLAEKAIKDMTGDEALKMANLIIESMEINTKGKALVEELNTQFKKLMETKDLNEYDMLHIKVIELFRESSLLVRRRLEIDKILSKLDETLENAKNDTDN